MDHFGDVYGVPQGSILGPSIFFKTGFFVISWITDCSYKALNLDPRSYWALEGDSACFRDWNTVQVRIVVWLFIMWYHCFRRLHYCGWVWNLLICPLCLLQHYFLHLEEFLSYRKNICGLQRIDCFSSCSLLALRRRAEHVAVVNSFRIAFNQTQNCSSRNMICPNNPALSPAHQVTSGTQKNITWQWDDTLKMQGCIVLLLVTSMLPWASSLMVSMAIMLFGPHRQGQQKSWIL